MKYKVEYIDKNKNRAIEVIQAPSKEEAIRRFLEDGYRLISVEKVGTNRTSIFKPKVKDVHISQFFDKFHFLLHAGLGVKESLETLGDSESNPVLKEGAQSMYRDLNSGMSLGESVQRLGIFPPVVQSVIYGAEESAQLEKSMEMLSKYFSHESKLKENIKSALYYPAILVALTLVVVTGVMNFVFPRYIDLFNTFGDHQLPWLTRVLIVISKTISKTIPLQIGIVGLLIYYIYSLKYNVDRRRKVHRVILKLPFVGKYFLYLNIQRFAGTLSILLGSGISLLDGIDMAKNTITNEYLKSQMESITTDILKGYSFYSATEKIEQVPTLFLSMIKVGENTSQLEKTMESTYDYYSELTEDMSKKFVKIFEPLIILFLGLTIGSIVVGIVLPTFSIIDVI